MRVNDFPRTTPGRVLTSLSDFAQELEGTCCRTSQLHIVTRPAIGYLGLLVWRGGTSSVGLQEIFCHVVWIGCCMKSRALFNLLEPSSAPPRRASSRCFDVTTRGLHSTWELCGAPFDILFLPSVAHAVSFVKVVVGISFRVCCRWWL